MGPFDGRNEGLEMSEDLLQKMLNIQQKFQQSTGFDPEVHQIAAALAAEAGELWGASGGKWWRKQKKTEEEIDEELMDCFHFLLAACLNRNLSSKEIYERYIEKMEINIQRQKDGY
jgi:dimeric dUTPase (all-alpha-NTP-PPase superfamily)